MKVKDLIERLGAFDAEAIVYVNFYDSDDNGGWSILGDVDECTFFKSDGDRLAGPIEPRKNFKPTVKLTSKFHKH